MTDNLKLLNDLHMGKQDAEDELVKNNMPLVCGIARRFCNSSYDIEELIQIGSIGLIKAVRRFDFNFDVQFSTYAVPVIIGEIKRFLRDDGIIKVGRENKTNSFKINAAKEKLNQKLKRIPTISEISEECGISIEKVIEAMEATAPIDSIHRITDDGKSELGDKIGNDLEEKRIIDRVSVAESMKILSSREKKIIVMRYYYQKTQSQIAKVIGVSQVQISRLEKGALKKMRDFLNK